MAPVTEIAFLPIKSGLDLESDGSPMSDTHTKLAQTVLTQPGCQRLFWSREVENPDHLRWFIDWDSIEDHQNFMKTPEYKPFYDAFGDILADAPQLWHAEHQPHPPKVLDGSFSPTTEVVTLYFPIDLSTEDQTDLVDRLTKLAAVVEKTADGFTGFAGGWIVEDLVIPDTDKKGKAYSLLYGWQSVEAHLAFRETQAFKDNIHLLRQARNLQKVKMIHVHGKQIQKV